MCQEAPGLTIEKNRLVNTIGGTFLGIVGDQDHDYGYHLCEPDPDDYSGWGALNVPACDCACAIDIGMDWAASRTWLQWLIREIRENRIRGIAEVIGSFDGENVRYWSDESGWQQEGVQYYGPGHDRWSHVAIYRSTAKQDHGILAGWTAIGYTGGSMATGDEDFVPYGRPKDGGGRNVGTYAADSWGHETLGKSPYDGAKSQRTLQLERIEATGKSTAEAVAKLSVTPVDVAKLAALLTPVIQEAVRAELAKLTLKAVP